MRSLALLLLLVNISFLLWQLSLLPWLPWQPIQFEHQILPPARLVSNIPQIQLLQEFEATTQPISLTAQMPIAVTPAVAEPALDIEAGAKTASVPDEEILEITTAIAENIPLDKLKSELKEGIEHARHASPSSNNANATQDKPDNAKVMMLKSQPSQLITNDSVENEEKKYSAPLEATNTQSSDHQNTAATCFQSGHHPPSLIEKVIHWFNAQQGAQVKMQSRKTQIIDSTWVYLPPFENKQAAYAARSRLARLGITDYMVVTTGHLKNAISLGLYRDQQSVKRRLKELNAKGYTNVRTEKRYKDDTRYWLSVKIAYNQHELLSAFKKAFKDMTLKSVVCE